MVTSTYTGFEVTYGDRVVTFVIRPDLSPDLYSTTTPWPGPTPEECTALIERAKEELQSALPGYSKECLEAKARHFALCHRR